ncbi:hypothetical protein GCM10010440_53510 [Kitasatospora cinereorecta]
MPISGRACEVFGQVPVTVPGRSPGDGPVNRSLIHPVALNVALSSGRLPVPRDTCGDDGKSGG